MQILAKNKTVLREVRVIETYLAGIVLKGTEIKSLRSRASQITESHIEVSKDLQVTWVNAYIPEYAMGNRFNHDPKRPRRLLLKTKEIEILFSAVSQDGMTIIPLNLGLKNGLAKLEIALAKGKKSHDHRQVIKEREDKIVMERAMKLDHRRR